MTVSVFVGTSVGSAMAAGFAKNYEADHLERGAHEIFVKSRSFRRPTWPRYALLDHKAFDRALATFLKEGVDPNALEAAFRRHAASMLTSPLEPGLTAIAVDGKTLKGSRRLDDKAIHVLSAFSTDLGAVIGDLANTSALARRYAAATSWVR